MEKRTNITTLKGNPLTLVGPTLTNGQKAPDFKIRTGWAQSTILSLANFTGKNLLISIAPSLDTAVCQAQTRKFNEKATTLDGFTVLTVTSDLPQAQSRFCTTEGISNLTVASDYADKSFGQAYGYLIDEFQVLARGVVLVDKQGVIQYVEITKDLTVEPNYDAALAAAAKL